MFAEPVIDSAPNGEAEDTDQWDAGYLDGHRDAILTVLELAVCHPNITVNDVLAVLEEEHPTLLTKHLAEGTDAQVRANIAETIRRHRLILTADKTERCPPEWAPITPERIGW